MKEVTYGVGIGVTSALGAFVSESINEIAIWLVVMFTVILADLAMKVYKIIKRKDERIRYSKGVRDTMAKCATYFAFVVTVVFVQNATNIDNLAKIAILVIISGEALSVAGNYLKAHGLDLDEAEVLNWAVHKFMGPRNVIHKEGEVEHCPKHSEEEFNEEEGPCDEF